MNLNLCYTRNLSQDLTHNWCSPSTLGGVYKLSLFSLQTACFSREFKTKKQKTDKQNKAWWQFDPSTAPVEENGPVASLSSSQCLALPPLCSRHQINLFLLAGGLSHIISSLRAGIRGFQTQRPVREQNVGKMAVGIKHRVCLFSHTFRPGESCGNKVQGPGRP